MDKTKILLFDGTNQELKVKWLDDIIALSFTKAAGANILITRLKNVERDFAFLPFRYLSLNDSLPC
jgi:hypothetical protein